MPAPVIDSKKCNLCETCVNLCPMEVFRKGDKEIIVEKPKECIGCRACEVQCEKKAITILD